MIGAGDNPTQPCGRVLPNEPFNVERWHAMDADVHFIGKRVIRDKELPIREVDTRIVMRSAVLTLDPLRFAMAGGAVVASLRIGANAKPSKGTVALDARKLQLQRLFEKIDGLSTSLGDVSGSIKLSGSGNSIAAPTGSLDGSVKLLMVDGKVSGKLMEVAGLNVANIRVAKPACDRQIGIDCAAADFSAKNGVLRANLLVFDTGNALIDIDGDIRLADERVALILHPHTKSLRVFSLRSPHHVEGTFQKADISVGKKTLLACRRCDRAGLGCGAGNRAGSVDRAERRCAEKLCAAARPVQAIRARQGRQTGQDGRARAGPSSRRSAQALTAKRRSVAGAAIMNRRPRSGSHRGSCARAQDPRCARSSLCRCRRAGSAPRPPRNRC